MENVFIYRNDIWYFRLISKWGKDKYKTLETRSTTSRNVQIISRHIQDKKR